MACRSASILVRLAGGALRRTIHTRGWRTSLQQHSRPHARMSVSSALQLCLQVRAFFPGVSAPLIGGSLESGVNYVVYVACLDALTSRRAAAAEQSAEPRRAAAGHGPDTHSAVSEAQRRRHFTADPALADVGVAAAVAGVALSFVLSPVELVKCRLQVHGPLYLNPAHCVRLTVQREGWHGLTRGLGATMLREIPGNAIFFTVYEVLHVHSCLRADYADCSCPLVLQCT